MNSLMPHGFCLASAPWLIWGLVVSDLVVAAVYFAIPGALLSIHRNVGFPVPIKTRLGALFATFIFLCGGTHLLRALTMFSGGATYFAELCICVATACASIVSLVVLIKSAPAVAMQLRAMGHALEGDGS
jgi:hypothetical protein